MKAVENISKIVLTNAGKQIGYVLNVVVDLESKKKTGYYVVDEESESELFLNLDDCLAFGDDFILVDEETKFDLVLNENPQLLGKRVLSTDCLYLGVVKNLCFKKKTLEKIATEKCEILSKYLLNVGQDFVLVSFKKFKTKKKNLNFPRQDSDFSVQIQNEVTLPEKVNLSTKYYIGKISDMDIFGYNNERIIAKGEIISKEIVEKAKVHNKLNQLFFALNRKN